MSAKPIYEYKGKQLLNKFIGNVMAPIKSVTITSSSKWDKIEAENEWLHTTKLVVKPDQLLKRRGKLGLIKVNADLAQVKEWVNERMNKEIQIGNCVGKLKNFIIEPFVAHNQQDEYYVCIYSHREGETILFHHEGGVDIGDADAKSLKLTVQIDDKLNLSELCTKLLTNVANQERKEMLAAFIMNLFQTYMDLHFTYLEINPIVITGDQVHVLDLAAKLDQTAEYLCRIKWGDVDFPPPFGRDAYPEEAYISDLDSKSGASLKLTILNPNGRIWTMVAGGGASVIYTDTICDLGGSDELANYGEYSGAPSEQQTYEYAKTILSLMTKERHDKGKVLLIGGGIANFTNVAATFKGIVKALHEYHQKLIDFNITIYVRRGGPNFQEGLRVMREVGEQLSLPIFVFGPETHMTSIVAMALGKKEIPVEPTKPATMTANFLLPSNSEEVVDSSGQLKRQISNNSSSESSRIHNNKDMSDYVSVSKEDIAPLFTSKTKAIIWGMQTKAVQGMLDFDHVCSRKEPSVVAMIYPFTGDHKQKFYWGHHEILIPIYKNMSDAMKKHPNADVLINFASLRSSYESTMETLIYPQIRTIAIIAEGIPEQLTRRMIRLANQKNVVIIGPATVGGLKPGCFKIGNTGGMLDNILLSKLFRSGSVAYVSRSGGMSNELNNIISRNSNGVYEGVAIGGDRYPGTTFIDHILRYEDDPEAKMIVLLGEVGGVEEYKIVEALKTKRITKPLIAWCIGTCAAMFTSEVQFGHAGSCANGDNEQAVAKNEALMKAGAFVPTSFDNIGETIKKVYDQLVESKVILTKEEPVPPTVPMDYDWARELGLIRKPASFMSSICDDRGQELLYAGMPITDIIKADMGIGGVLSLLWFRQR
jgi:ATP citrate (pro-S)-lyase